MREQMNNISNLKISGGSQSRLTSRQLYRRMKQLTGSIDWMVMYVQSNVYEEALRLLLNTLQTPQGSR